MFFQPKKSSKFKNKWGNESYEELIIRAIQSSYNQRLTLQQIYDWITSNVEYFSDKKLEGSSGGWKVSYDIIKHFYLNFISKTIQYDL